MNFTPSSLSEVSSELVRLSLAFLALAICLPMHASVPEEEPQSASAADQPYNVLLLAVDDLNNVVGYMGGKAKTPYIDRLSREGIAFTNAYCPSPSCSPSRTSIMTRV